MTRSKNKNIIEENDESDEKFLKMETLYNELLKGRDMIISKMEDESVLLKELIKGKDQFTLKLQEEIERLKNRVQELERCSQNNASKENVIINEKYKLNADTKKTYVSVVNDNKNQSFFIKPVNLKQNFMETKKDIKGYIKPTDCGAVKKITNIGKGVIRVECRNEIEMKKIKDVAEEKFRGKYRVDAMRTKRPKIKIVGVEEEMEENDLIKCIIDQNSFIKEDAKFKLVKMKKMKYEYFAIVECDGESFKKIMEHGALCIDLAVCTVFEYVSLLRCFKCFGFSHSADKCTKIQLCLKCFSKDHDATNCKNQDLTCPNCLDMNQKHSFSFNFDHSPFDSKKCNILMKKIENEKKNINYNSE